MKFFTVLALAGVALAANETYTWRQPPNPRPTGRPNNGRPPRRGRLNYAGCYESSAGFPTFALVGSSEEMTIDLCVASCPSGRIGVFGT